jgi:membrane-bound ClpP family serine protease
MVKFAIRRMELLKKQQNRVSLNKVLEGIKVLGTSIVIGALFFLGEGNMEVKQLLLILLGVVYLIDGIITYKERKLESIPSIVLGVFFIVFSMIPKTYIFVLFILALCLVLVTFIKRKMRSNRNI